MGVSPSSFSTRTAKTHSQASLYDDITKSDTKPKGKTKSFNAVQKLAPLDYRDFKSPDGKLHASSASMPTIMTGNLVHSSLKLEPLFNKSNVADFILEDAPQVVTSRVPDPLPSIPSQSLLSVPSNNSIKSLRHSISSFRNLSDEYDEADELVAMCAPYGGMFVVDTHIKDLRFPKPKNLRQLASLNEAKQIQVDDIEPYDLEHIEDYLETRPRSSSLGGNEKVKKKRKQKIDLEPTPIVSTTKATLSRGLGKKRVNQYENIRLLGKGAHGKVYLCRNIENNVQCAVKMINKSIIKSFRRLVPPGFSQKTDVNIVKAEIAVLKKLNHPNVVKLLEVIDDPEQDKVYLVFEYIDGGELLSVSSDGNTNGESLTETEARACFRQLIMALEYLHDNNIIHRDIKPSNCLLSKDGILKLSDFGVSKYVEDENSLFTDSDGTPAFLPPESCGKQGFRGKPADIWASGITLYLMIYGELPFKGMGTGAARVITLYRSIQYDDLEFPEDFLVSLELKDLLRRILDKNPETRITMDNIINHPWVAIDDDGSEDLPTDFTEQNTYGAFDDESPIQSSLSFSRKASMVSMRSGTMSVCSNASMRSCVSRGSLRSFKEVRNAHKGHVVSISSTDVENAIEKKQALPKIKKKK
jgi:[calcium/calmodulin-dependent protein kinase] kinase